MNTLPIASVLCSVAAAIPAQMAGSYVIDPGNPAAFASFSAAVQSLVLNGVNGDVDIAAVPGTYTESIVLPSITGASPTNTITFRSAQGPGTVLLHGSTGTTIALVAAPFARNRSIVFDGLEFTGAPGSAISATTFVEDIEIRNCVFRTGHSGSVPLQTWQAVIASDNIGDEVGWRVHHNRIAVTPHGGLTSIGIRVWNGGDWEIHHNTFDVTGCNHAIYLENNAARVDRIHDNLFFGTMSANSGNLVSGVACIRVDLANYENEIAGNTFALDFPGYGCCIASGGVVVGANRPQNYIRGNVFVVQGNLATAIALNVSGAGVNPIVADGNLYDSASGITNQIGTSITTANLDTRATWQAATGQDTGSLEVPARLQNPFGTPPDLRPTPTSPIVGLAVGMPAFVTDDFAGRLRDAQPDAGAYESTGFALHGAGCPGAGGLVPAMATSGVIAIGSTSFTIELQQAVPGALALLTAGLSRTQSALGPLPFPLGASCFVLASPEATLWSVSSAAGTASAPFPIPALPALFGTDVFFQWAVHDPASASSLQVAVSAGGALQL